MPSAGRGGVYTRKQLRQMSVRDLKATLAPHGIDSSGVLEKSELVDLVWVVQQSTQMEAGKSGGGGSSGGSGALPPRPPLAKSPSESRRNPSTQLMECGICNEAMGTGTTRHMGTAPCGHMYCLECWLKAAAGTAGGRPGKCPTCRRLVTPNEVIKLYAD